MRLSPRRQQDHWLRYRDFGEGVAEPLLLRSGMVEMVRMGQGDPIVLVPGLAGGWRLLAPLARRLATRHEVILYSLRGDRKLMVGPGPESLSEYAHDLAELIQELRLERPTVLGVSFGGAIALELAVRYPNLVGALAVQGAEARFRSSLGSMIARRVLERFPLPSDNGFVNQFFNVLHGCRPEPGRLPEFVVERCWETDQSVMASRLRALEQYDVSAHLSEISAPTLVLARHSRRGGASFSSAGSGRGDSSWPVYVRGGGRAHRVPDPRGRGGSPGAPAAQGPGPVVRLRRDEEWHAP